MALFRSFVTFRDLAYMAASSARVPIVPWLCGVGLPSCAASSVSLAPIGRCGGRVWGCLWLGLPLLRAEPHAAVSRRASCLRASLGRSRGRCSCCPASTCWAVLLQRQAGCPDPAPRSGA